MFSIKKWIQAAVLVSVHLLGLYAQPGLQGASFNPNLPNPDLYQTDNSYIWKILETMARKGDKCLTDRNITGEKQILVIAVLSGSEYAKRRNVSDDRVEIIPNECIDNPPPYMYVRKTTTKVHGEILAIYIKKTIDELLSKLAKERTLKDAKPYVFIFSHYIPCACVANVPYSCAEELANLGRVNRNRYEIIVGYRDVANGSNVSVAETFLQEGGIHTAINISSSQMLDKRLKIEPEIYQKQFTVCLGNLTAIPKDSAACFINTVTKNCTSGSDLYGYMTQYSKAVLHECVENYVYNRTLEFYARYCSLHTLSRSMRLMLGQPTDMCEASWTSTQDDLNWKELYIDFSDATPSEFSDIETPSLFLEFSAIETSLNDLKRYCEDYLQNIANGEGHTLNQYQMRQLNKLIYDIDYKRSKENKNNGQQTRKQRRNGQSRENRNQKKARTRDRPT